MALGIPAFSLNRFGSFGSGMAGEMASVQSPRDESGKIIPMHARGGQEENEYRPLSAVVNEARASEQLSAVVHAIQTSPVMHEMAQSPVIAELINGLFPTEQGQIQTAEFGQVAPVQDLNADVGVGGGR